MAKKLVFCGWDVGSGSSRSVYVIRKDARELCSSPSSCQLVHMFERLLLLQALNRLAKKEGSKMNPDKAWFNVGAKCNPRMKEVVRNAHMVLKGACVVERGTCYIKPGKLKKGAV